MRRIVLSYTLAALVASVFSAAKAVAADWKKEVVYQVFTDRFYNGNTNNDDPEGSKGLFDKTKTNWAAYWGGDLEGIRQKLDYIKGLGATAIWFSPAIDCVDKVVINAEGKVQAAYHGYHGRDFKRIEEHFGDADKGWKTFDALVEDAHKRGMKIMVDLPLNHTSEYNHGDFGALWDDGEFKGDVENDRNKYWNHLPLVKDYNDRYQLQYGTIFYLGDLNQENEYIDRYLKSAAEKFLAHGADATRLDAAKHTNWGWQQSLANSLHNKKPHFVVAEWWLNDTREPLYKDAVKFVNSGGMSMFDFALANAMRKVLAGKEETSFSEINDVIEQEYRDFEDANGLITFIDNHDMPRFLSLNNDRDNLHIALALLITSRGTPSLYYGTEQYLHDDTNGGGDPYTRLWMSTFDEDTDACKLIKALTDARKANPAFAYGKQTAIHVSKDCYIFERRFGDNLSVIAINKSKSDAQKLSDFKVPLPAGTWTDVLNGSINGSDAFVEHGGLATIELKPSSVSIWSTRTQSKLPLIGSLHPRVINGGAKVTVSGIGFGEERGNLKIGNQTIDVESWSDECITFSAPHLLRGQQPVIVCTTGGDCSEPDSLNFLEAKSIPVRISVKDVLLDKGEQLFISGNCHALGHGSRSWMKAAGPMLAEDQNHILVVPLPAKEKVEYRLVILNQDGKLVKEESKPHSYQVPELGVWTHSIKWQN